MLRLGVKVVGVLPLLQLSLGLRCAQPRRQLRRVRRTLAQNHPCARHWPGALRPIKHAVPHWSRPTGSKQVWKLCRTGCRHHAVVANRSTRPAFEVPRHRFLGHRVEAEALVHCNERLWPILGLVRLVKEDVFIRPCDGRYQALWDWQLRRRHAQGAQCLPRRERDGGGVVGVRVNEH